MKENGFLISIIREPSLKLMKTYRVKAKIMASQPNPDQLEEITKIVEAGKIKTDVSKIYHFQKPKKAQKLIQDRNVRGKIIFGALNDIRFLNED